MLQVIWCLTGWSGRSWNVGSSSQCDYSHFGSMELCPCQSKCFLPHSLRGKWMWGVPSLTKICHMCHILCIYINILVFCIYSFYVFVTKQCSSLTASAAMRAWKKGGKRSLFHSPLSAMKGGSALLSPSMVEATTISLLHEATVEEELKRWFFTC